MKRVVSLILIFSILFGLFAVSANAVVTEIAVVGTVVVAGAGFFVIMKGLEQAFKTADAYLDYRSSFYEYSDVLYGDLWAKSDSSGSDYSVSDSSDPYAVCYDALQFSCGQRVGRYLVVDFSTLSDIALVLQSSLGIPVVCERIDSPLSNAIGPGLGVGWPDQPCWVLAYDRFKIPGNHACSDLHALVTQLGYCLVSPIENDNTMISNDGRNYYVDEGDTVIDNSDNSTTHIYNGGDTYNDNSSTTNTTNNVYNHETNRIFDYTNGQWWDVGELYYDASSKTYTANYQTHVGDVYYDYSMHWTYNIDYTSITYLGSSETYDIYNIYYELPDGRSSADLTAEDLEQLNLEYDVINYGLNCDDASLRALYHFDGDTQDSSYWSAYSNFDWISGASISYLEANEGFEGCLYLDESTHQFTVTLPSPLSYKDFSVLFRYYQMDTLNTDKPSISARAGDTLFSLAHNRLPVGSWMELGAIRHNGILRIYLNGIPFAGGGSNTSVFTDNLRFTFSDTVQCVRYFDELRVFDYAIVGDGADYTPIVQAQTTNLVLSLPGEARPIPDEYWNFNSDGNLFPLYDLVNDSDLMDMVFTTECESPYFSSSGLQLGPTGSKAPYYTSGEEGVVYQDGSGYLISLFASDKEIATDIVSEYCLPGYICGATYTFSVLLSDGTLCSLTFSDREVTQEFSFGSLSFYCFDKQSSAFYTDIYSYVVAIQPKVGAEIVYWELVAGPSANSGHEKVSVVYDPLDLDGPTIAIRSQIPVNLWKLGGVRPTIPERGDVWCGIQSSSIYSSQIYNGFAWVECEIRIWTDKERWVSAAYYNVLTQQDFYDIQGTTDKEHLQTQQGFYTWFQTQWKQLLEILQTIDSRIEKLGSNSASGVELNFNIDGTIDVTFTKLAEDGRNGVLKIIYTFWELIFVDVFEGASSGLDNMSSVYGRDKQTFSIDGQSGWTVWSIISADQEDLWE